MAVAVCLLSVAGALEVGPGAALADGAKAASSTDDAAKDSNADDPATDDRAADGGADPGGADDDWLTYDDPDSQADQEGGDSDEADPSADRALPAKSGDGKRIVFSESRQRVWLVGPAERVVRTYAVSGSRHRDNVVPGTYSVYSKSRHAISYDYRETMNYMVRFTQGNTSAIGFHDLPRFRKGGELAQTRAQLGQPLSAGCVRQWIGDARALWTFAPVGTTVVVTP